MGICYIKNEDTKAIDVPESDYTGNNINKDEINENEFNCSILMSANNSSDLIYNVKYKGKLSNGNIEIKDKNKIK